MTHPIARPTMPWWHVRMMWLVVGGPALVVVASFALLAVAIRGGDTPLLRDPASAGVTTLTPATQARNHAVTPRR